MHTNIYSHNTHVCVHVNMYEMCLASAANACLPVLSVLSADKVIQDIVVSIVNLSSSFHCV